MTCIQGGRSLDTSMGMTPLEGYQSLNGALCPHCRSSLLICITQEYIHTLAEDDTVDEGSSNKACCRLMMMTRCGDLDCTAVILHSIRL